MSFAAIVAFVVSPAAAVVAPAAAVVSPAAFVVAAVVAVVEVPHAVKATLRTSDSATVERIFFIFIFVYSSS